MYIGTSGFKDFFGSMINIYKKKNKLIIVRTNLFDGIIFHHPHTNLLHISTLQHHSLDHT